MAHPYAGHKQNAVGHRRVKLLLKTGGRATGGATKATDDYSEAAACPEPDGDEMGAPEGAKRGGRLDKRARGGGIPKRASGGSMGFHKLTPSKHKPHTNINIVNVSRPRPAIRPIRPIGAPMGLPALPAAGAMPLPMRARGGRMRSGKKYGEGSGEGRLEEFKHMKGK